MKRKVLLLTILTLCLASCGKTNDEEITKENTEIILQENKAFIETEAEDIFAEVLTETDVEVQGETEDKADEIEEETEESEDTDVEEESENETEDTDDEVEESEDDTENEFWWHRNCAVGTAYLDEKCERHCFYLTGVHYEVTESVCYYLEAYRDAKFDEWADEYRGFYVDENTLELHTLGAIPITMTLEEFEEAYSGRGFEIFVIYDSLWDFLVAQQTYVEEETYDELMRQGYIQILPTP